jgi:hypothetical protein
VLVLLRSDPPQDGAQVHRVGDQRGVVQQAQRCMPPGVPSQLTGYLKSPDSGLSMMWEMMCLALRRSSLVMGESVANRKDDL